MSNKLMQYLPNYYRTSEVITNITSAQNIELEKFQTNLDNTLNQFFIDLADASLERWEKELGIPINNNKAAEYRKSVIKSKLRGRGTITVNLIKNVSESYSNGEVDVIEDNSNYQFTVKFIGTKGIPPNLDDLKNAIEDIKPAHLGVNYEFTYLAWDEFENYNKTFDEWDLLNLTWDEFETYQE